MNISASSFLIVAAGTRLLWTVYATAIFGFVFLINLSYYGVSNTMESLQRLQELHEDLIGFTRNISSDLERLSKELEDSIADFRNLLDQRASSAEEVADYNAGKIHVAGQGYAVNEEFRHISNAVGSALSISEEYAARLLVETQPSPIVDDQAAIADVVQKYHDRRDFLLQDLRLVLAQALEPQQDAGIKSAFQDVVRDIIDNHKDMGNGPRFTQKCIEAMTSIEAWQVKLNEAIESRAILSQARGAAFYRTLEFQRSSLFKQHEALGAILALLFRLSYTSPENLRVLHKKSQDWYRLDFGWIHYLPAFSAAFQLYGSRRDNSLDSSALIALDKTLVSVSPDTINGPYRPLAATLEMWWTAEYSAQHSGESSLPSSKPSLRDNTVKRALDDGGLEFMLSICTTMINDPLQLIARQELVEMLLDGSNISFHSDEKSSDYFITMMMEAYETFAESWITNMPDSIRRLKTDEDGKRLLQVTATPEGLLQRPPREQGARLHLEAFLAVIAFAYEGRPDAAEQFWDDPDSNLHGFLQWASRRQTVPRVSAFCEMLCAISNSVENAEAAHQFLLDSTVPALTARGKTFPSMSYGQIFEELEFYSRKVHEKGQASQAVKVRGPPEPEMNEAESPIMLCCYLRLLGHLFEQTPSARQHVLQIQTFDPLKVLLALNSGPVPSYLKASIFNFFESLLTDKNAASSERIWLTIEDWASTGTDRPVKPAEDKQQLSTLAALQQTLTQITYRDDQYDAFLRLLIALVSPMPASSGQPLPFPSDLGSGHRVPGIVPYIDLALGHITPKRMVSLAWLEDPSSRGVIRLKNAFVFATLCLQGFNEHYVESLSRQSAGSTGGESYAIMYMQRHPFSRTMQWLFTFDMLKCMGELAHGLAEEVLQASPNDPRLQCLEAVLHLMNSMIDLQPTFFDIVKPRLRSKESYKTIPASGIAALEDAIISQPELLLDMCKYAASDHVQLSLYSLEFLRKLSESSRFQNHLFEESSRSHRGRRMLEMIGTEGELKLRHISSTFAQHFSINPRELDGGSEDSGYLLKNGIVSFFNSCLSQQSDAPNLAHLLLGFKRIGPRLMGDTALEEGKSAFDALAMMSVDYPEGLEDNFLAWLINLKAETIAVLKHLWSFPISSEITMVQLRRQQYLTRQMCSASRIEQQTIWDGKSILDPDFYFHTSAEAFTAFLSFRTHFYDYVTREIQSVTKANVKSLQEKYLASLQGRSLTDDGKPINHLAIYDLFDFAELDTSPSSALAMPRFQFFRDIDFEEYQKVPLYDIELVQAVLNRRSAQIADNITATNQQADFDGINEEAAYAIALLEARNRCVLAHAERISCLKSYVDMIITIVDCCPMDLATKTQFALHMLQLILPKLDTYLTDGVQEAVELTRMADTLLVALGNVQSSTQRSQTRVDVTVADKLFQLFRISAEGIQMSINNPDLRTVLYSICSQYLARIITSSSSDMEASHKARSNAMDTIRSAGSQLLNILSDDADDGLDTCRLNALNLLAHLVSLARSQNSTLVIATLVKSNIIEVLLDPIKTVAEEFQATEPSSESAPV